jgi:hypothetical protein
MYQKPTVYNVTLTSANTEYSRSIPANARKVFIRERSGLVSIKLAYASGQSGTTYLTIPAGTQKTLENCFLSGVILYMQSGTPGTLVEVEVWTNR